MFSFITYNHKKSGDTCNPLAGTCQHGCEYCWANNLKKIYPNLKEKYSGKCRIILKEFNLISKFTKKDFVFLCDMTDLFGEWVPSELIQLILDTVAKSPAQFLLLTKNPKRYLEFSIPPNCVCGATIETDLDITPSFAPPPPERIVAMINLKHPRKMVSVEPIMKFSPLFGEMLLKIKPDLIAIGYDNYNHGLMEPTLTMTMMLENTLEDAGIKIYQKTIREKSP